MRDKTATFIKGFCMGIADIIPGISGGTIAFILGIYTELIDAIKSFDSKFTVRILTFKWGKAFSETGWEFLFPLVFGIFTAILVLAKPIKMAMDIHPVLVYAFFFGLIISSAFIISKVVRKWRKRLVIATAATAIVSYFLFGMVPVQTPNDPWFIFLSGAIAICAMILPGVSGSFILLLLGKYEFILDAVHHRDLGVIAILMAGMLVGIFSFVRVISWLLHRFHDPVIAILLGLVIGSLRKVWPWHRTVNAIVKDDKIISLEQINMLPYPSSYAFYAVGFMIIGFLVALYLEQKGNMLEGIATDVKYDFKKDALK